MYYILKIASLITVISAIWFAYYSIYHKQKFDDFCNLANYGYQDSTRVNCDKHPWFRFDRLWRNTFFALAIIGYGYLSYGIANHVFGWIPFIAYGKSEEGQGLLGVLSVFIMIGIIKFISDASRKTNS